MGKKGERLVKWQAILFLALLACWGPPRVAPVRGPTILVTNRGLGPLVIYDRVGRLVTVMPNQSRCVYLRDPHYAQALGYVIEGERYATPWFDPGALQGGWRIEIGTVPRHEGLSLRPLATPCNPAARQVVK